VAFVGVTENGVNNFTKRLEAGVSTPTHPFHHMGTWLSSLPEDETARWYLTSGDDSL
jgi:hypothetical protein